MRFNLAGRSGGGASFATRLMYFSSALAPNNRVYFAGNGGTIYYRDKVNSASAPAPTQLAFYGLAKLLETFDRQIFALDGGLVSGHTLKHLAAAMAGVWLVRMVWKRKAV